MGSNEFKLDTSLTFNPAWMSAKNNFPATQPGFYGVYADNPNPPPATSFYSPVVNLGGPIVKDKLWFYGSYGRNDIRVLRLTQTFDKTLLKNYSAKLNWQATGSDMVSAFWFLGDKTKIGRAGSAPGLAQLDTVRRPFSCHRDAERFQRLEEERLAGRIVADTELHVVEHGCS